MLLSMSKQFFTARLFTLITLNQNIILAFSSIEGISYLPFFQRIAKFRLTSPAMDGLPVGLSHLGFSGGTEGNLNKPDLRVRAKVPPQLARKKPACSHFYLTGVSPILP